jgi:hypothetical protein
MSSDWSLVVWSLDAPFSYGLVLHRCLNGNSQYKPHMIGLKCLSHPVSWFYISTLIHFHPQTPVQIDLFCVIFKYSTQQNHSLNLRVWIDEVLIVLLRVVRLYFSFYYTYTPIFSVLHRWRMSALVVICGVIEEVGERITLIFLVLRVEIWESLFHFIL